MGNKSSVKRLKLRPSDASRWTTCTASPYYIMVNEDKLPEETRDYTDEGSRAHKLAELMLNGGTVDLDEYPEEMVNYVKGYAENVMRKKHDGDDLLVEEEVTCYYNPEQRGFIDAGIISADAKKVYFDDLKYGAGVSVQARYNKQLAIYARSAMEQLSMLYDFEPDTLIVITIYQPRIAGEDAIRLWSIKYSELVEWTDDNITAIAADILDEPEDQMFAPSDEACQFCPAAAICTERLDHLAEGLEVVDCKTSFLKEDDTFTPPTPECLSGDQISTILQNAKALKKWLEKVQEYATEMVYHQKLEVPGFKTVASRKKRVWVSESDALNVLKTTFKVSEITTPKLVTPTQAEELIKARKRMTHKKRKQIQDLITKPVGGPTLVPESDNREPLLLIEAEFEDENDYSDIL